MLLEEWIASILHARKGLELLENRNGLYVLYIDRLIGDVAKRVGQSSFSQKLHEDIRSSLFSWLHYQELFMQGKKHLMKYGTSTFSYTGLIISTSVRA